MLDRIQSFTKRLREGDLYARIAPWVVWAVAAILATLLLFSVQECRGQDLTGGVYAETEVWAGSERCYQNAMEGGGELAWTWRGVSISGAMRIRWWGACDAKAKGSFLNAEAGRVISRTRELTALYSWGILGAGVKIYRTGVHHIWRTSEDRYGGFPASGDWRVAQQRCQDGEVPPNRDHSCPSIGYFDRLGPTVVLDPSWARAEATVLLYQWKDNTLPPKAVLLSARANPLEGWHVGAGSKMDLNWEWGYDLWVRHRIEGPFWLGLQAGRIHDPGWTGQIRRVAATVSLR